MPHPQSPRDLCCLSSASDSSDDSSQLDYPNVLFVRTCSALSQPNLSKQNISSALFGELMAAESDMKSFHISFNLQSTSCMTYCTKSDDRSLQVGVLLSPSQKALIEGEAVVLWYASLVSKARLVDLYKW